MCGFFRFFLCIRVHACTLRNRPVFSCTAVVAFNAPAAGLLLMHTIGSKGRGCLACCSCACVRRCMADYNVNSHIKHSDMVVTVVLHPRV